MDHFDKSTNVENNRNRISKLVLVLSYLVIWAVSVVVFWCFTDGQGGMGYSLMFLWIILPAATLTVSFLIGKNNYWGKRKWIGSLCFGIMYMLGEYATFSMANNITFGKVNAPAFSMLAVGVVISLAGMGVGHAMHVKREGLKS